MTFTTKQYVRIKERLWVEQNYLCSWCFQVITLEEYDEATLDHWIPKSHPQCGGSGKQSNLRIMHGHCNHSKNNLCVVCSPWVDVLIKRKEEIVREQG